MENNPFGDIFGEFFGNKSALEYKEWRNFEKSVDKAKLAEKANEIHFVVGQKETTEKVEEITAPSWCRN